MSYHHAARLTCIRICIMAEGSLIEYSRWTWKWWKVSDAHSLRFEWLRALAINMQGALFMYLSHLLDLPIGRSPSRSFLNWYLSLNVHYIRLIILSRVHLRACHDSSGMLRSLAQSISRGLDYSPYFFLIVLDHFLFVSLRFDCIVFPSIVPFCAYLHRITIFTRSWGIALWVHPSSF